MLNKIVILFALLFLLFIPANTYAQVHARPISNAILSPAPTTQGTNLSIYSDPVTVTITAAADTGYKNAND